MDGLVRKFHVRLWMFSAVAAAYGGALAYYSYLLGLTLPTWAEFPVQLWCLPCANVDTIASPAYRF
jgi:hypothetical protein